ncbi:MAG: hypothetical protein AB8B63_03320 [Granulosicoccus sp.]
MDVTGIKDTEQLRILKDGLFDIVSLRLRQVSRDEPTILGLDLVGLNQGSGGEARAKYYTLLHARVRHAPASQARL